MYPSVMSPLVERSPYARPAWPRDANAVTRAVAETILVEHGLLRLPPSPARDPAALRQRVVATRAHTAALSRDLAVLFASAARLRHEAQHLRAPPD
jgi:hypothetical protein